MQLIIDIGNTRIKFALFEGQTLFAFDSGEVSKLKHFIQKKNIKHAIISSVAKSKKIEELLISHNIEFLNFSYKTKVPISNKYATPKTLGDDRLANVIGGNKLYPNKNILVIDCGTCIKYDFINQKNEYIGGAISLGLKMRFKALNKFTENLPLIKPKEIDFLEGDSTENSILSGIVNGTIAEINGIISQYSAIYENLTIILTGGDTNFFDTKIKSNIFVNSNLTLIGLNEILLYNTKK